MAGEKPTERELRKFCKEYIIKMLELQRVRLKGADLFKPDEIKKVELDLIEESLSYVEELL